MATLKKLKLTQLGQQELAERQMSQIRGGNNCGCECAGSSSKSTNHSANWDNNLSSPNPGGGGWCSWEGDSDEGALVYGGSHIKF